MRSLLLFWFSVIFGLAQGDTLRNKTFTKPLILKGTKPWVVENCRFEVKEGKVGLEVGCKRRVQIQHCTFIGFKENGIGVITFQDAEVTHCNFKNLAQGLVLETNAQNHTLTGNTFDGSFEPRSQVFGIRCFGTQLGGSNTLNIQSNTFKELSEGIRLVAGQHTFANLRCNEFIHAANGSRTGVGLLVSTGNAVGLDAARIIGPIGGNGDISQQSPNPNANVWPRNPSNTSQSPPNWVSIQKADDGGFLDYFRYTNEFIGIVSPSIGNNRIRMPAYLSAKSPKAINDWCAENHPNNTSCMGDIMSNNLTNYPDWPNNWSAVCNDMDDDVDPFELRLDVGSKLTAKAQLENQMAILGEPIPNPADGKTFVPIFWTKEKGLLVVFEIGTGKEKARRAIQKGQQMIEFDIRNWPSGIYGYRLEGESPCPEPKRLVIIH